MKLVKIASVSISLFLFVLFFLWFLVTQPVTEDNTTEWKGQVDKNLLKKHVKTLSSILPHRSVDVDELNHSAKYIYKELKKYSIDVKYQKYSVMGVNYYNVIATFGPKYIDSLYVVGAHYDSFDGLPGADDNASGVAGIIELARLFSLKAPPVSIQLVAFSLEEPPYFRTDDMGSYVHAKSLHDDSVNVALMISLEMIGYFSEVDHSQKYPVSIMEYVYPTTGNFISVVGGLSHISETRFMKKNMRKASPLSVYSINAPSFIPGIDFSDHLNYWYFDYPAVMVTDTSFYRNKNYHTKYDTWDKLDYIKMAMVVQGVYQSLLVKSSQ